MKKKFFVFLLFALLIFLCCQITGEKSSRFFSPSSSLSSPISTYTVVYDANGGTGSVPIESNTYAQGQTVWIFSNGSLTKNDFVFTGWNTNPGGSGTTYSLGQSFPMGASNVTLYARWTQNPTYTVTYNATDHPTTGMPVDTTNYEQGQPVVAFSGYPAVAGSNEYYVAAWNTKSDGSGTTYFPRSTFPMGISNVILYAVWNEFAYMYNSDGNITLTNCGYSPGSVSIMIPSSFAGYTVTSIGGSAFAHFATNKYVTADLTDVTIPSTITSIGDYAFYYCTMLTGITIPSSVTGIGDYAFGYCTGITSSISIPSSVTSIGKYAFAYCTKVPGFTILSNNAGIGPSAFYYCIGLTSITIPTGITSIGSYAFGNCKNLSNVYVQAKTPPALPAGSHAFDNCAGGLQIHVPSDATGQILANYKNAVGWSDYASVIVN